MKKNLSLLDFVLLNQENDYPLIELKKQIKAYGPLEYNIKKHRRLLNKIPEINNSYGNNKWLKSRPFHLMLVKIEEIESRIDKYISLMLEAEIDLPEIAFNYVRLQELVDYIEGKPNIKENINDKLESQKMEINKIPMDRLALWAIADDMRGKKDDGEFETYRDAYRWAKKNISKKGVNITIKNLERAFYKARSEGKVE